MGIQGLMSYVGSNRSFLHDVQLRNTKLIIDGNNLYHKLYFDAGLDLAHGGDYDAFSDILSKFLESLSVCRIHAYVVFDGGCDVSNKKLETLKQRCRDKIKMAQSLTAGRGGTVLPLLVREVCLQVLRRLGVPFIQCFSEADKEIVALANLWHCPVLSFDSDFCIFDLKAGYCPLNTFQWKDIGTMKETKDCYVPARCFSAQKLCHYFNNMNLALLPLFAVLTGNDYISLPALETFFSKVHLPFGNIGNSGRKPSRIQGLLNWLSGFATVEEAMENVLGYLKLKDREGVRQLLYSAMEEYDLHNASSLEQFFQGGLYVCPTAAQLEVPNWVQCALAKGYLSPLLSDALVLKRVFLHVQVEDLKRPSAHFVSSPVRKVIYALLLGVYQTTQPEQHALKRNQKVCVEEFDRLETSLRKAKLSVTIMPEDRDEVLSLQNIPQLPVAKRLKLLLNTAGVSEADVARVPTDHQLTLAALCYWVRHAEPAVQLHHFKAVLMGIVYGHIYKNLNTPTPEFPMEGLQSVCEQMKGMKSSPLRKLNLEDAHILCQWQCCLQMLLSLNQLLCAPLPEPDITRLYSGSLVYQLVQKLKTSSSTEDIFKPCPPLENLYQDFLSAVMSSIPADHFQSRSKPAGNKSKKRKNKPRKNGASTQMPNTADSCPDGDTNNRFASLCIED